MLSDLAKIIIIGAMQLKRARKGICKNIQFGSSSLPEYNISICLSVERRESVLPIMTGDYIKQSDSPPALS